MKNFTPEMIQKAKNAKNPEELLALAKEQDIEMTAEEAKLYMEQLSCCGELSNDDLDNVSGGGCGSSSEEPETPADFGYPSGQRVYYHNGICPECSKNGFYNPSQNFVLEWIDYPGGHFRLHCEICNGVVQRTDDFFSGNPQILGIARV